MPRHPQQSPQTRSAKTHPGSEALAPRPFATPTPLEGEARSPATQASEASLPAFSMFAKSGRSRPIQPKLTIGAPHDKYEQEADRVAKTVVQRLSFADGGRSRPGTVTPPPPSPPRRQEAQPDPDKKLQMKPLWQRQGAVAASDDLENAIQQSRGSGQPLADLIRQPMEQAFGGVDFSGVNVHTDERSDQLNRSIQARAFTTGQDIFFRQGAYQPGNQGGQELLAHELTHVVQQAGGSRHQGRLQRSQPQPTDHDFSQVDLFSHGSQRAPIQMKLAIGAANNPYEQKADPVAAQVINVPDGATLSVVHMKPVSGAVPTVEPLDEDELQLKPASGATPSVEPLDEDELQRKQIDQSINRSRSKALGKSELTTANQQTDDGVVQRKGLDASEITQTDSSNVVQRVKTPNLPDTELNNVFEWYKKGTDSGKIGQGIDDDKVYRNYLLVMKWQLRTNASATDPLVAQVDTLLAQPAANPITRNQVEPLIDEVNRATPNAKTSAPQKAERLNSQEETVFTTKMTMACQKLGNTITNADAVKNTFQGAVTTSEQTAKDNYENIKNQLNDWKTGVKNYVQINRSENAGYSAFCLGSGATSQLMLSKDFFKKDDLELAGTLIHEASHGRLGTKDLAYMSAPYFLQMKDDLALHNADHYAYAVYVAEGKGASATNSGTKTELVKKFDQALSLCYYKCSKIASILNWLTDAYGGTGRDITKDTKETHEQLMQMGGKTDINGKIFKGKLAAICKERTIMFKDIIAMMQGYTNTPKTLTEHLNYIKIAPIKDWPEVDVPAQLTDTVEVLSKQIFVHFLTLAHASDGPGFTDAQANDIYNWEEGLFADMIKNKDHKEKYHISPEDEQLYQLLKS